MQSLFGTGREKKITPASPSQYASARPIIGPKMNHAIDPPAGNPR